MSQVNASTATNPVITFRVNLGTLNQQGFPTPDSYQTDRDLGRSYTDNQATTRVTWLPGLGGGENRELHHGDQFTVYGAEAEYLRKLVANGTYSFLSIVS